jgi:hypothetical protein
MSDERTLFADAAGLFESVVRQVKASQRARTGAKAPPPAPEPATEHPQTAWERRYATRAFRPGRPPAPLPLWGLSPPEAPASGEAPQNPLPASPSGPIGLAIGKPARKRSWVRRLFRGG